MRIYDYSFYSSRSFSLSLTPSISLSFRSCSLLDLALKDTKKRIAIDGVGQSHSIQQMRKEGSTLVKQTKPKKNIEATPKSVWPLGGAYHLGDTYAHKVQWWTKCGSIVGRILATVVCFWKKSCIWMRTEMNVRISLTSFIRWPHWLSHVHSNYSSRGHWSHRLNDYSIMSEERGKKENVKVSKPLRKYVHIRRRRKKNSIDSLFLSFVFSFATISHSFPLNN